MFLVKDRLTHLAQTSCYATWSWPPFRARHGRKIPWFEQFACLQVLLVLTLSFFQTNFHTYYLQIASCWIIVSQHHLHTRLRSTTFPWCGKLCAWHASYLRIKDSILITGARNGLVTKQFKLVVVLRSHHIVNTLHGHFWARIKIPKSSGQKPYGFTRLTSIPDCHQLQAFSE